MSDEQQRKGFSLLVSSMRKSLEEFEFVKSQMRLVTDKSIVDAKTFEERSLRLGGSLVGHIARVSATRRSQANIENVRVSIAPAETVSLRIASGDTYNPDPLRRIGVVG